jgi:hypothetical protein
MSPVTLFLLVVPQHTYEGAGRGDRMYSSYSFTTSELDGVEWSASRPLSLFNILKLSGTNSKVTGSDPAKANDF